jgi:hypothetical protein
MVFAVPFGRFPRQFPFTPMGVGYAKAAIAAEDVRIAFRECPVMAVKKLGMRQLNRRTPRTLRCGARGSRIECHDGCKNGRGQQYTHRFQPFGFRIILTPALAKKLH